MGGCDDRYVRLHLGIPQSFVWKVTMLGKTYASSGSRDGTDITNGQRGGEMRLRRFGFTAATQIRKQTEAQKLGEEELGTIRGGRERWKSRTKHPKLPRKAME